MTVGDVEIVDGGLVIRRVVVGDLSTNCWKDPSSGRGSSVDGRRGGSLNSRGLSDGVRVQHLEPSVSYQPPSQ